MEIDKCLHRADVICDYVPVISTVSNIANLFQKIIILPFLERQTVYNSHYFTHLDQKNSDRCVVLLIPILGNIVIGIYDFYMRKYNNEEFVRNAFNENYFSLRDASFRLRNDPNFILELINQEPEANQNPHALAYASDRLKDNSDFMIQAINQNSRALYYASERLKNDYNFMSAVIGHIPTIYRAHIGNQLLDHHEFMLLVFRCSPVPSFMRHVSARLRSNPEFMLAALQQITQVRGISQPISRGLKNLWCDIFRYASTRLKDNTDFMRNACQQNEYCFRYASNRLKDDLSFVQNVCRENRHILHFASTSVQQQLQNQAAV